MNKKELAHKEHNLAISFEEKKELHKATLHYKKAIKFNPEQWQSSLNLSNIFISQGKYAESLKALKKSLLHSPSEVYLLLAIGNTLKLQDNIHDAIPFFEKAYLFQPQNHLAKLHLGAVKLLVNRNDEANKLFESLLGNENSLLASTLVYLSHTFQSNTSGLFLYFKKTLNDFISKDDATKLQSLIVKYLPKGINASCYVYRLAFNTQRILPSSQTQWLINEGLHRKGTCSHHLWALLGVSFKLDAEIDKAIHCFEKSLKLNSENKTAIVHLADALYFQGHVKQAKDLVNKVIDTSIFTTIRLINLLSNHSYQDAWLYYNRHQEDVDLSPLRKILPKEKLNPDSKQILIFRDQGIGDEIMFLSCLNDFIKTLPKETKITLASSKRLHPLLDIDPKRITLVNGNSDSEFYKEDLQTQYDSYIRASKLPSYTRLNSRSFNPTPYLKVDEELVMDFKNRLASLNTKYKIGIAWKGGVTQLKKLSHSINFSDLLPLFSLQNTAFINLQYGDCTEEINWLKQEHSLELISFDDVNPLEELTHQAALIQALDLIVQVSNTSIHLAGALGKKCFCILPPNHDFRWFSNADLNPTKSSWYCDVELHVKNEQETWLESIHNLTNKIKIQLTL